MQHTAAELGGDGTNQILRIQANATESAGTSSSCSLFPFVVKTLASVSDGTRESSRNQESEQCRATIVPLLTAVADMTRG